MVSVPSAGKIQHHLSAIANGFLGAWLNGTANFPGVDHIRLAHHPLVSG